METTRRTLVEIISFFLLFHILSFLVFTNAFSFRLCYVHCSMQLMLQQEHLNRKKKKEKRNYE